MIDQISMSRYLRYTLAQQAGWRDDSQQCDDGCRLLSALLQEGIESGRWPAPSPPYQGLPERNATGLLDLCGVEWCRKKQFSLPSSENVDELGLTSIVEDTRDMERIARALILLGLEHKTAGELRSNLLSLKPAVIGTVSNVNTVEAALVLGRLPARGVGGSHAEQLIWVRRVAGAAVSQRNEVGAMLALGLQYGAGVGIEVLKLLKESVEEIDADLYDEPLEQDCRPRLNIALPNQLLWRLDKRSKTIELVIAGSGRGGLVTAGLPLVLEDGVGLFPSMLMALRRGDFILKDVRGARSRRDVQDLLSGGQVTARVHYEFEGDVSIRDSDLDPYRERLRVGGEWVRGVHKDVSVETELVVTNK